MTPVSQAAEIDPEHLPFLVQGIYLTRQRLVDLGKQFLIDDLHLAVGARPRRLATALSAVHDLDGTPSAPSSGRRRPGFRGSERVALAGRDRPRALLRRRHRRRLPHPPSRHHAHRQRKGGRHRRAHRQHDRPHEPHRLQRTARIAGARRSLRPTAISRSSTSTSTASKRSTTSIGHHGGDELVKALADRAQLGPARRSDVRPHRRRRIRRRADRQRGADTAAGAASAIVHSLDQPFTVHGFEFHVTASVGYAVAERHRPHPERNRPPRRHRHVPGQERRRARGRRLSLDAWRPARSRRSRSRPRFAGPSSSGELKVFYQPVVRAERPDDRRPRGAGSLDVERVRHRFAGGVHSGRRGDRSHPRHRPLRRRSRLPGPAQLARPEHGDQRLAGAAPRSEFRQRHPRRSSSATASARTSSSSS